MKLGCSSWSYHALFRSGQIDLLEWLRICAEDLEVDGVELLDLHFRTTDPIYLRDVKKLCTDLQLTISGIAVSNDFGPDERRAAEIAKVREWCDVAAYLGAPVVRVFAGWVPPQPLEPHPGVLVTAFRRLFGEPHRNTRRLWSDVTWAIRQCADYASERGTTVALQNNRSDGIVGTPYHVEQCLRDVGSPWLRLCLDPADLADRLGIEAALSRVVQVHARMQDVAEDGSDPTAHWPELLRMLRLGNYRGFVHIDYEGAEDPTTAVPRAARYLRGLLHLLQRQQLLAPGEDGLSEDGMVDVEPATNGASSVDEDVVPIQS